MKNIKTLVVIVGISAVLFSASLAIAQECSPGGGEGYHAGRKARMQEFMKEIGVTPEQREQLKESRAGRQEAGKAIRESIKAKKNEMREELNKPEPNEGTLNGIVDELTALQKEATQHRVQGILSMKKILTPEQFKAMTEKHKGKREGHRKSKGRRGPKQVE